MRCMWNQQMFDKLQERKFPRDRRDDIIILFRFDAARAVDQNAAGLEQRNCRTENAELLLAHSQEIWRG